MLNGGETSTFISNGAKKRRLSIVNGHDTEIEGASSAKRVKEDDGGDQIPKPLEPARRPMNDLQLPPTHHRPSTQLFIFGNGDFGQFGLGTSLTGDIGKPRLHSWFEVAVSSDILGAEVGAGIESVVAGGMHTLVVDEVGKVWSWGVNDHGALGRETDAVTGADESGDALGSEILESQPMAVQSLVDEDFRAVQVAAGDSVSAALGLDGQLRVWGSFRASDGLLGFNNKSSEDANIQLTPTSLPSLSNILFVQVACGTDHVLALTVHGTVFVWGNGQQAQLGRRIIERRKVNGLSPERLPLRRISYVSAGSFHSFAVCEEGRVYSWGLNNYGQTGVWARGRGAGEEGEEVEVEDIIWTPTEVTSLSPAALGHGRKVVEISGGEHHTLFLLNDGSVYGCGRCDGSELGLPDDHPEMIALESDSNGPASAGTSSSSETSSHPTCIRRPTLIPFPPLPTPSSPNPKALPYNNISHQIPAPAIPNPNPISHISASGRHNLAVSRAGHAYSWGLGPSCQLGLGSSVEEQKTPTRIQSYLLDELNADDKEKWSWRVENVSAGGQHCVLVARKVL